MTMFRRISRATPRRDSEYIRRKLCTMQVPHMGYNVWLRTLDGYGNMAAIADDMGLWQDQIKAGAQLPVGHEGAASVCASSSSPGIVGALNWRRNARSSRRSFPAYWTATLPQWAEFRQQWAEADLCGDQLSDLMRGDDDFYSGQPLYACIWTKRSHQEPHYPKSQGWCKRVITGKVRFALRTLAENRLSELWSIFLPDAVGICCPTRPSAPVRKSLSCSEDDKDALRRLNQLWSMFILAAHEVRGAQRAAPQDREFTVSSWTSSNASSTLPLWWTRESFRAAAGG